MQEVTKIERYEIRGHIVWDKVRKRPANLAEIKRALEFYSTAAAVLAKYQESGVDYNPF